ncbi:MAG: hypothetical protein M1817_004306 [Caeruleum heppii]|nr:MAG: hypothetical protein M1817_004306 [Caeruleum heppii]
MARLAPENHQERESHGLDFDKIELSMPSLPARGKFTLVDNLTSYLGPKNPFAHPFDPKTESLWLLDNTAYQSPRFPHRWHAEFVAAYFLKNSGSEIPDAVANIAEKLGIAKGDAAEDRIQDRLQLFADTILPARTVLLDFDVDKAGNVIKLGPGGRNGISAEDKTIAAGTYRDGDRIISRPRVGTGAPSERMVTYFAEPEGWAIISDIDDTIKTTLTPDPLGILRTTFVDIPHAIEGMPELYKHLHARLKPTWFYLSASPYNLYPFLREFLHQYYPPGTTILRDASWMNLAGILTSLTKGTQSYKVSRCEKVHTWLPNRKMVCIGDSTQTDPETYGDICRMFPGWVKAVYIRKVEDVAQMKGTDKNEDERFEKAFQGVDRKIWKTFVDPAELHDAVERL